MEIHLYRGMRCGSPSVGNNVDGGCCKNCRTLPTPPNSNTGIQGNPTRTQRQGFALPWFPATIYRHAGHVNWKPYSPFPFVSLEEKVRTLARQSATSLSQAGSLLLIQALWSSLSPPTFRLWLYVHPPPMKHIHTVEQVWRVFCIYLCLLVTHTHLNDLSNVTVVF